MTPFEGTVDNLLAEYLAQRCAPPSPAARVAAAREILASAGVTADPDTVRDIGEELFARESISAALFDACREVLTDEEVRAVHAALVADPVVRSALAKIKGVHVRVTAEVTRTYVEQIHRRLLAARRADG